MSDHARISPSKLERIMACPASVGLSEHLPPSASSSYAEEGTLLHAICAECLERRPEYNLDAIQWDEPEHRFLVSQCLGEVDKILSNMVSFQLFQDTRVFMKDIDCNGTLDVGIYGWAEDKSSLEKISPEIHIIDFKFGGGIEVFPQDNPQLMAYLDGFCDSLSHDYVANPHIPMYVWIFQPRLQKFESERIFAEDLQYFRQRLEKTIRLADGRNPPFHPEHPSRPCRWCPAGAVCKHRMANVKNTAIEALEAHADIASWDNSIESIQSLATLLRLKSSISSAMEAIEHHLFTQLSRGHKVPGYKLVSGRARRQWAHGVDAFTLNDMFPQLDTLDLVKSDLRSPAQVEKLLNKEDREALAELIIRVEGEPTMAPESSVKEALNPFAEVTGD